MATQEFDRIFEALTKEMLEIVYEFAGFNKTAIESIYLLGSADEDCIESNFFYQIQGTVVAKHSINDYLDIKVDVSRERQVLALQQVNKMFTGLLEEFRNDSRTLPTVLKIMYSPQSEKFSCKLSYDKVIGTDSVESYYDLYTLWMTELQA